MDARSSSVRSILRSACLFVMAAIISAWFFSPVVTPGHAAPGTPPPRGERITPLAPPPKTDSALTPVTGPRALPTNSESSMVSGNGFLTVGFDRLSAFKYEVPENAVTNAAVQAKTDEQIPATVKAFNNERIALKGFMLPLKLEGGLVTELLIMRDQSMCCFGTVPKINEWVSVKMTGKGVKPVMDQAVTLFGKLKVGGIVENGYLVGIYAMDGEKMDAPGL